jgi:Flp pilus assembly pilin Flp
MKAAHSRIRADLHSGAGTKGELEDMWSLTKCYLRLREEKGQTLAEYALILGLIAVVAITAVTLLGGHVSSLMNTVAGGI